MRAKIERDIEKSYSTSQFVAKLRRFADALESGKHFRIQIAGEKIGVPAGAEYNIEHEREGDAEEIEFIGVFRDYMKENGLVNDKFDYIYLYKYDEDLNSINFDRFEMTEIKFVTPDQLLKMEIEGHTVPHKKGYFQFVIDGLIRKSSQP